MSLETMPAREIRLDHVGDFCDRHPKPRESVRLDFKAGEVPNKLGHVISAFANTQGGMILLGVAGDADNRAVWPPTGVPAKGLSERVQEIANAIHPPVVIDPSEPLLLESDPDRAVLVIRIPESDSAPHAVDNGRKIYERTGDVGRWEQPIHADRLERMFARRRRAREDADQLIAQALERAMRVLPEQDLQGGPLAVRYVGVLPAIPGRRSYLSPSDCQILLARWRNGSTARMPLGSYKIEDGILPDGKSTHAGCVARFSSIDSNGLIFSCEITDEESIRRELLTRERATTAKDRQLSLDRTWNHARSVFQVVRAYYEGTACSPGWLRVAFGLSRCQGVQVFSHLQHRFIEPQPFLDDDYRDELLAPLDDFIEFDGGMRPLLHSLAHGFDVRNTDIGKLRLEDFPPVNPPGKPM